MNLKMKIQRKNKIELIFQAFDAEIENVPEKKIEKRTERRTIL